MKMSPRFDWHTQWGYSLRDSLVKGETSKMKGPQPHFCLLIWIEKNHLICAAPLPELSLAYCLLPPMNCVFKI